MSLVEERFRPELIKTYPRVVQPVKPRYELKGSARHYNMFKRRDVANSASSLQFEFQPTNLQTIVRRDMRLSVPKFTYRVTVRINKGTTNPFPEHQPLINNVSNFMCLRDHPLNRALSSPRVNINNTQVSLDLSQMFQQLNLVTYDEDYVNSYHCQNNIDLGMMNYKDAEGTKSTPISGVDNLTLATQFAPDGTFPFKFVDGEGNPVPNNGTYEGENGVMVRISNGVPQNEAPIIAEQPLEEYDLYLQYDLQEVPFISPLLFDGTNGLYSTGLWSVERLQFTFPIVSNPKLLRTIGTTPNAGLGGATTTFVSEGFPSKMNTPFQGAEMLFQTTEAPQDLKDGLPPLNVIPQTRYNVRITPKSELGITSGGTHKFISDTFYPPTIPQKICVDVRIPRDEMQASQAPYSLPITNLSVMVGNDVGQISTFDEGAIYDIVRKYIDLDYNTYRGMSLKSSGKAVAMVSVPVWLTVGEDIILPAGKTGGLNESLAFQVTATVKNQTGATIERLELALNFVDSELLYNENGTSQIFGSFLTEQDVLNARQIEDDMPLEMRIGGKKRNLMSTLSHGASTIGRLGKKALKSDTAKSLARDGISYGSQMAMSKLK